MSVILGCALAGSAILFSDSRVTIKEKKLVYKDELRKIFQLAPYLAVAFVSENVSFTHRILKALTEYSYKKTRSQNALYLLNRLSKLARYEYNRIAKKKKITPPMELIFAGVLPNRKSVIKKDLFNELLKKQEGSFQIPKEILFGPQYKYNMKDGIICSPPASIILKQSFPSGEEIPINCGGFAVAGSGKGVGKKILESWHKIFLISHEFMRISMLRSTMQDYIKEQGITSIGGLVQSVQIDKRGVVPLGYSIGKIDKKGNETWKQTMTFEDGKWVQFDSKTKKKIIIQTNPLILNQENNEFPIAKSNF